MIDLKVKKGKFLTTYESRQVILQYKDMKL